MKLKELLAKVGISISSESHPALEQEVKGLTTNSIACQPGDLFLGMPGTRVDGGEFWPSAIASGAVAAIISPAAIEKTQDRITAEHPCIIPSDNLTQVCAQIATAFYDHPAEKLRLVGVIRHISRVQ